MVKKRFGLLGKLKDDMVKEYCDLHANTWPGVLKMIKDCNIQNYSIFLHGNLVFSYFEYVGEDYDADMAKMAADPETRRWWERTHPCFERYAIEPDCEFTPEIRQVFFCE